MNIHEVRGLNMMLEVRTQLYWSVKHIIYLGLINILFSEEICSSEECAGQIVVACKCRKAFCQKHFDAIDWPCSLHSSKKGKIHTIEY